MDFSVHVEARDEAEAVQLATKAILMRLPLGNVEQPSVRSEEKAAREAYAGRLVPNPFLGVPAHEWRIELSCGEWDMHCWRTSLSPAQTLAARKRIKTIPRVEPYHRHLRLRVRFPDPGGSPRELLGMFQLLDATWRDAKPSPAGDSAGVPAASPRPVR